MNAERLSEKLSIKLYESNVNAMRVLLGNNPEMQYKADVEFNNFLFYIRRKIGKIFAYCNNPEKKEPKIFKK